MPANRRILLLLLVLPLLAGCAGGRQEVRPVRPFPEVRLPAMLSPEDVEDYVTANFWDAYLDTAGRWFCDSTHIAGVDERIVATQLATFVSILENGPADKAQAAMEGFFDRLERHQLADTASNAYPWLTEAVEYYLYDPNSDARNEELFLPFVTRLAASPCTKADLRERYAHAATVCATNRIGSVAPDFRFCDAASRAHTLHGEKAPLTVLLFINPGCRACEETVAAFSGEAVEALVAAGKLKILGIYIDEDVAAWKEQAGHLPAHWITGYDPDGVIRADRLYYVRAIPSVYVLDADKRILLKDAVPESAARYILNAVN